MAHQPRGGVLSEDGPTRSPAWRRWLRRALALAAGTVLLLLVTLVGGVAFVHTDAGFAWVKARVLPPLNASIFTGELSVGRLEGSLFGRFVLSDLSITDDTGQLAASLERIEVTYDPWALLEQRVHVMSAELTGPKAWIRTSSQGVNMARLVHTSSASRPSGPSEPTAWSVEIDRVTARAGRAEAPVQSATAEQVAFEGSFAWSVQRTVAHVSRLTTALNHPALTHAATTTVAASLHIDDGGLRVQADLTAEGLTAEGQTRVDDGRIEATLSAQAGPGTLHRLVAAPEDLPLDVQAELQGDLPGPTAQRPLRARLSGRAARFSLDADASLKDGAATGWARARGRGLSGTLTATRTHDGAVDGQARIRVAALSDVPLPENVDLDGSGQLDARVNMAGPDAPVKVTARARVKNLHYGAELDAAAIRIDGTWSDARKWRHVDLDAELEGFRAREVRVDQLRLEAQPAGRFQGLRQVAFRAEGTGFPVAQFRVAGRTTLGLPLYLNFDGGFLKLGPRWEVEPFRLEVTQERIRLEGFESRADSARLLAALDTRLRPFEGSGRIDARGVRLEPVAKLLPGIRGGRIDVEGEGRWGPEIGLQLGGSGHARVELDAVPEPIRLDGELEAQGRTVDLSASVEGPGQADVEARLELPPRWSHPETWTPLRLDFVEALTVDARKVRLDGIGGLGLQGQVEGRASYRRGQQLQVRATAQDLVTPASPSPTGVDLELDSEDRSSTLHIQAQALDTSLLEIDGRIEAGLQDLIRSPAAGLLQIDFRVEAESHRIPMAVVTTLVPLPERYRGAEQGTLTLDAFAIRSDGQLTGAGSLHLRDYRPNEGAPVLDADAAADVGEVGWTLTSTVQGKGLGRLTTQGTGRGWSSVRDLRSLDADLQDVQILGLRALLGFPVPESGTVSGQLHVSDRAEDGVATLQVQRAVFAESVAPVGLQIVAQLEVDSAQVQTRLFVGDRPALSTRFEARGRTPDGLFDAESPLSLSIRSKGFEVPRLFRPPVSDEFDGQLELSGGWRGTSKGTRTASVAGRWVDGRSGGVEFEEARLRAELTDSGPYGTLDVKTIEGGRLDVKVDARSDRPSSRKWLQARAYDFDLSVVSALLSAGPAGQLGGELTADVSWLGPESGQGPDGVLDVQNLEVLVPGAPALTDGQFAARLQDGELLLELDARSEGDGRFTAEGSGDLEDLQDPRFQLRLSSDEVRTLAGTVPIDVTSKVDVTGEGMKAGSYRIDVNIRKLKLILPDEPMDALHPVTRPENVVEVQTYGVRVRQPVETGPDSDRTPAWIVKVHNEEPITFRGIDGFGSADLKLKVEGYAGGPVIQGEAGVNDGQVTLFGRDYRIEKAQVAFRGARPPDPTLDVRLVHDFDSMTLTALVQGSTRKPKVRFAADPSNYDQAQLFAFFAGLSNPDNPGQPSGGAGAAAAGVLLGPVTREARRNLPLDTIDVSFKNRGDQTAPVVTLGKWLNESLFVAYSWNAAASSRAEEQQQGILRYRISRRWVFEMMAGLTSQSADILWTKRF